MQSTEGRRRRNERCKVQKKGKRKVQSGEKGKRKVQSADEEEKEDAEKRERGGAECRKREIKNVHSSEERKWVAECRRRFIV